MATRDGNPRRKNLTAEYANRRPELEKEFQAFLEKNRHFGLMVHDRAKKFGDREELIHKTYGTWERISWNEMSRTMHMVSASLIEFGIQDEDRVGIYSANRPEWHLSDLGALCVRAVTVPIYPTNSTKEAEYIVNDAGIRVLFVGRQEQYDRAYPLLDRCACLEHIVVFHRGTTIDTGDPRVMTWDDFLATGAKAGHADEIARRAQRCHWDDKCTLIYTSGTTGEPKGAVHTHKSLMHNSWAVGYFPQAGHGEDDMTLCMLPLSHVLERSWDYGIMQMDARICYCEDHTQILEIMKEANATIMNSAPRLFEKIYSTIHAGVQQAPPAKQKIFRWAMKIAEKAGDRRMNGRMLGPWLWLRYRLAHKLVLHKIVDLFGNRMHHLNAGGAPLSPEIARFFYNAGVLITVGYGLTETAPVLAMNGPSCFKFGSCGPVVPLVDIRIDPETGEIQARGPNIVQGYFNKPKQTAEAFTEDGWFRTGDIGRFDEDGYLYITDRIKDLIITSGGKNIAPQLIESLMTEDFFIEYIAIIGDARNYLTALVVPSFSSLEAWALKKGLGWSSREELVGKPEVVEHFKKIIDQRQKDLGRVEQIKKFTLLAHEFSQDAGEITPTMKVKRKVVEKKYADIIERMYREG